MDESRSYRLKLVADDAFIEQLKTYAAKSSSGIAIQTEAKEHDATKLGFDVGSVITVVSVVSAAVNIIKFSGSVIEWLRKSKANKVVLQTPFGTLELHKSHKPTKEDVRKFLEAARQM